MARIDFAFGAPDRLRMACEVVHKHYLAGRRMFVYCTDTRRLERFDLLLWGFERTAFVPHVSADDELAEITPVHLSTKPPPGNEPVAAWLLNLDTACVPEAHRYTRILEIVSHHEADKTQARDRWRAYKDEGHELHAHDVGSRAPESPA